MSQTKETSPEVFLAWAPHFAVFAGIFMMWIDPGPRGSMIMYAGFLVYGTIGAWASTKKKYYQGISIRLVKLLVQGAICALASLSLVSEINGFIWILILIIMDTLILTPARVEPDTAP